MTGHALALEGAVFVATHGGWLHALSPAADGLVHRFRVPLGGHAQAGPVVGPTGHLWIGTDAGEVLRLDPQDGQIELRLQTDGPADTALAVHPDGFLLVAAGKRVLGLAPDGARRFSFSTRGKVFTTPAIDAAGNIYIAAQDHTLYSLDADGRLRFEREAGRFDLDAGPLIEPAGVWVGDDAGVLHAYDRDGRLRRHSAPLGGHLRAPLSLGAADTLLVHVFGPRSRLLGLDPADASVRFEYRFTPADGPAQGSRSGPLVDRDGRIYVGSHDGQLHALSPDGRRLFVVSTRARIDATPTLGPDGTLYFGSQDGRLYAVLR